MFPALQPSRPKPRSNISAHSNNEQTRHNYTHEHTSPIASRRPQSQIEAFPPSYAPQERHLDPFPLTTTSPLTNSKLLSQSSSLAAFNAMSARLLQSPSQHSYNPALRHPVFFTERWRKVPPLVTEVSGRQSARYARNAGEHASPIAEGYVWGKGRLTGTEGPKL